MKKRVGMNKKLIAIISVIIILCGAAAGLWYNRQHSAEQPKTPSTNVSDAAKFKSEYPRVAANNRFVYTSDKEILDIFDHGTEILPVRRIEQKQAHDVDGEHKEKQPRVYAVDRKSVV